MEKARVASLAELHELRLAVLHPQLTNHFRNLQRQQQRRGQQQVRLHACTHACRLAMQRLRA